MEACYPFLFDLLRWTFYLDVAIGLESSSILAYHPLQRYMHSIVQEPAVQSTSDLHHSSLLVKGVVIGSQREESSRLLILHLENKRAYGLKHLHIECKSINTEESVILRIHD